MTHYVANADYVLEYSLTDWGELIYGTEGQLKALGLGVGSVYPKAGRKSLLVRDVRGYVARINKSDYRGDGVYSASISLPDREPNYRDRPWFEYCEGVKVRHGILENEYQGNPESILKTGLVKPEHMPGAKGVGKVCVTISADGRTGKDRTGTYYDVGAGAKRVKRISSKTISVSVRVSKEVADYRRSEYLELEKAWTDKVRALPRPKPLTQADGYKVWSEASKKDLKFQTMMNTILDV